MRTVLALFGTAVYVVGLMFAIAVVTGMAEASPTLGMFLWSPGSAVWLPESDSRWPPALEAAARAWWVGATPVFWGLVSWLTAHRRRPALAKKLLIGNYVLAVVLTTAFWSGEREYRRAELRRYLRQNAVFVVFAAGWYTGGQALLWYELLRRAQ